VEEGDAGFRSKIVVIGSAGNGAEKSVDAALHHGRKWPMEQANYLVFLAILIAREPPRRTKLSSENPQIAVYRLYLLHWET